MSISARDKAQQLLKQAEAGEYLQKKRNDLGFSLMHVGEIVGCSPSYLSELERGLKLPSDILISKFARFYKIDESDLFGRYGKVPLSAIEEVEKYPGLQKTLLEINRDKGLSEEEKHAFYDKIYKFYIQMHNERMDEKGG